VPPDDPYALGAAIVATLERRDSFDPLVLRAHVMGRFGGPAVATRIADLYDAVLEERGRPAVAATAPALPRVAPVPDRPVVLVALDRAHLDRHLAGAPAWAIADTTIVTVGRPLPGRDAVVLEGADAAAVEEVIRSTARARQPGFRGLFAALPRWLLRRRRRGRLLARVEPLLAAAVERAVAAAGEHDRRGRVLVVCAGGIDVVAVNPFRGDDRVAVAAGCLRWLGDLAWCRGAGGLDGLSQPVEEAIPPAHPEPASSA
jgi:hypothetical protein